MTESLLRYDRNIRLFGEDGQRKLREASVVVAGSGGLGSPLAQQLALLGVGKVTPIDDEELDETNRNRFVGARHSDPVPGSLKVDLVSRLVREINPDVMVDPIPHSLVSERSFAAVKASDYVFGCFDEDGPRFVLNEICAAYRKPYIDLASDVPEPGVYGGRVCVSHNADGCIVCLDELDMGDVNYYLANDAQRETHDKIYGIDKAALEQKGPSVAPLNSVIAGLAAMEFMVLATGLRVPRRLLHYSGHKGTVASRSDAPKPDCFICKNIFGAGVAADVERYLSMPHLQQWRR